MRLRTEFIKLPLKFDADMMLREIQDFDKSELITHPNEPSNLAVILVSVGGQTNHEFSMSGGMRATPFLQRCAYLQQVLASLRAPISRSRLMILPAGGSVPPHDDIGYHWYRRVRVHIPIVTNSKVTFYCNGKSVHMAPGEAWIFDNFLRHHVHNEGTATRIHLVADTKGSDVFWKLVEGTGQSVEVVRRTASGLGSPEIEPYLFEVLTPREVASLAENILGDARGRIGVPDFGSLAAAMERFKKDWEKAFVRYGHSRAGLGEYRPILDAFLSLARTLQLFEKLPHYSGGGIALGVVSAVFTMRNGVAAPPATEEVSAAIKTELKQTASR